MVIGHPFRLCRTAHSDAQESVSTAAGKRLHPPSSILFPGCVGWRTDPAAAWRHCPGSATARFRAGAVSTRGHHHDQASRREKQQGFPQGQQSHLETHRWRCVIRRDATEHANLDADRHDAGGDASRPERHARANRQIGVSVAASTVTGSPARAGLFLLRPQVCASADRRRGVIHPTLSSSEPALVRSPHRDQAPGLRAATPMTRIPEHAKTRRRESTTPCSPSPRSAATSRKRPRLWRRQPVHGPSTGPSFV